MSFLFEYSWVLSRGEWFYNSTIMIIALNQFVGLLFLFSITTDQRHFLTFIVCIPCYVSDIDVNSKCEGPKWILA